MFIQVISGKVTDVEAMDRLSDRWEQELRPGAKGFLGVTQGVTDDGRFVVMARFESAEAAAKNSERPEQGEWFAEMEKVVEDVTFHDCSRVETLFGGGKNEATFVQVMQGRVKDRAKADAMFARSAEAEKVLGGRAPTSSARSSPSTTTATATPTPSTSPPKQRPAPTRPSRCRPRPNR